MLLLLVCALILSGVACGESNAVASQAGSTVRMRNASGQSDRGTVRRKLAASQLTIITARLLL